MQALRGFWWGLQFRVRSREGFGHVRFRKTLGPVGVWGLGPWGLWGLCDFRFTGVLPFGISGSGLWSFGVLESSALVWPLGFAIFGAGGSCFRDLSVLCKRTLIKPCYQSRNTQKAGFELVRTSIWGSAFPPLRDVVERPLTSIYKLSFLRLGLRPFGAGLDRNGLYTSVCYAMRSTIRVVFVRALV